MKFFLLALIPVIFGFSQKAKALDVEVHVHNPCVGKGTQCFQMDVYLDGSWAESWVTSPGNPNNNDGFKGSNTPEYVQARFTSNNGAGYRSHRGDPMPYAMHINGTGFAVHGSSLAVDGTKRSHGCMRLKTANAKKLNAWVRQARKSGGLAVITVEHTKISYSSKKKKKK